MRSSAETIVQTPAEKDDPRVRAEERYRQFLSQGLVSTQIVRIIVKGGYPTVVQAALEEWAEQNIEGKNNRVVVTDYDADRKMLIAASILDLPDKESINFGRITETDETQRIVYVDYGKP